MDLGLKNKLAVITGGSVGVGLEVAEAFASEGANVLITARDSERVQREAERIGTQYEVVATGVAANVATADGCAKVVAAAGGLGGADMLINNAGTGSNEKIAEATDDKWQYYWDLHVMAAVRLGRGLVPQMKGKGRGAVIHKPSICAVQPLWYEPIYNTTKVALMMFSKPSPTRWSAITSGSTRSIPGWC